MAPQCPLHQIHFSVQHLSPRWYGSVAECWPAKQEETGSIPREGTRLGFRPVPNWGRVINVSLTH